MAYTVNRARALARKRVSQRISKTAWLERNGRRFIKNHFDSSDLDSTLSPVAAVKGFSLLDDVDNLDPQGC